MQKIKSILRIYLLYALLFLALGFHTFLIGIDMFGFLIGAYGILIAYPWNLLAQVFAVILLTSFGLFLYYLLASQLEQIHAVILALSLVFLMFILIVIENIIIAVLFDVSLFALLVIKEFQINEKGRSIDELEADQLHIKILFGLVIAVALINYVLWFTQKESHPPSTFRFLTLLMSPIEYNMSDYAPITGVQYEQFVLIGSSISFLLRAIILSFYAIFLWQTSAKRIAIKKHNAFIWQVSLGDHSLQFDFIRPDGIDLPDSIVAKDQYSFIFSLGSSFTAEIYLAGIDLYSEIMSSEQLRLKTFQEKKIQQLGINLANYYNLSEHFLASSLPTRSILLVPYNNSLELALENIYFPTPTDTVRSIGEYAAVFRHINAVGLPITLPKQKRILHIGSLDLPSILLQKKLERLTQGHLLTFQSFPSENSLTDILKPTYDILIISLHGTLDGDNNPYYYYFDADDNKQFISPEDLADALTRTIPVVLTPTCLTTSPLSSVDFPDVFIESGSTIIVASSIPVLTSHLPLIILPFVESIVKLNEVTLATLHQIMSEVYFAIKRFGFVTQWNFLRTFVQTQLLPTQN